MNSASSARASSSISTITRAVVTTVTDIHLLMLASRGLADGRAHLLREAACVLCRIIRPLDASGVAVGKQCDCRFQQVRRGGDEAGVGGGLLQVGRVEAGGR